MGKGMLASCSTVICTCSVMSVRSNKKELLQTEGTVILHITCALKQDPELRKVFTKSLKVCLPGSIMFSIREWGLYHPVDIPGQSL